MNRQSLNNPVFNIDQLLHQTAPPATAVSKPNDLLTERIMQSVAPVGRGKKLLIVVYGVATFSGCLLLMLALSVSWWLIGASFAGALVVSAALWKMVSAMS